MSSSSSSGIRTYHAQFGPLEINPTTGEPFLRLRNHQDIILTPPRQSDAEEVIPHMNDPRIHDWIDSIPVPYTLANGEWFINQIKPACDAVLRQLDDAAAKYDDDRHSGPDLVVVDGCPVRAIRHVVDGMREVLIGDIGVRRAGRGELVDGVTGALRDVVDWEAKEASEAVNEGLCVGDPGIVWEPGCEYYAIDFFDFFFLK